MIKPAYNKTFLTAGFKCSAVDPVTDLLVNYEYYIGGIIEIMEAGEKSYL